MLGEDRYKSLAKINKNGDKLLKENKKRDYDALYWMIGPMQESDLEALRLGRF